MADVITEIEWPRTGKTWKYPWNLWLNGQAWRLEQGVDFECKPINMIAAARSVAYRRALVLRTSLGEDAVTIQALPRKEAA